MEQVELLISYGADPNVADNHGNSLITCARLDILNPLLKVFYHTSLKRVSLQAEWVPRFGGEDYRVLVRNYGYVVYVSM